MSLTNAFGDVPITNPQAMRALAHPTRLAILTRLQGSGPATATMLAPLVGATPSVTSWHLRHLAGFGLVVDADPDEVPGDRRQRWWKAIARGFRIENPDSEEALLLNQQMVLASRDQVDDWFTEVAPTLEADWRPLAGLSNTTVPMTPAELKTLQDKIEELIAPYVRRKEGDAPAGTRTIRILRHYLPS